MAFKMKAGKDGPMKKNFPDLNKDGKITQADILMGRGVIDSPNKMYGKNSPAKNYMNPQDYKVFNMGNKPTPVKMYGDSKNPGLKMKHDDSPMKGYKSDAQRKAVHASKAEKSAMSMKHGKKSGMKMYGKKSSMKAHKAGHDWEPAYEGGDYSWDDLAAMSKKKLKSMFPDTHEKISRDLAVRKIGKGKDATRDDMRDKRMKK